MPAKVNCAILVFLLRQQLNSILFPASLAHQIRCGSVQTFGRRQILPYMGDILFQVLNVPCTYNRGLLDGMQRRIRTLLHTINANRSPFHRTVPLYLYVCVLHFRLANALFATVTDLIPQ